MNLVKIQNEIKDFSDQQLVDSLSTGSTPHYIVLAEMQRRKQLRSETQQEGEGGTSVLEDTVAGLGALPQAQGFADGGAVSTARDATPAENAIFQRLLGEAFRQHGMGVVKPENFVDSVLHPWMKEISYNLAPNHEPAFRYKGDGSEFAAKAQRSLKTEEKGYAKGGYLKGEKEACWKNPETGAEMCPPSKPTLKKPATGGKSPVKKMADGGAVPGPMAPWLREYLTKVGKLRAGDPSYVSAADVPLPETGDVPVPVSSDVLPPEPVGLEAIQAGDLPMPEGGIVPPPAPAPSAGAPEDLAPWYSGITDAEMRAQAAEPLEARNAGAPIPQSGFVYDPTIADNAHMASLTQNYRYSIDQAAEILADAKMAYEGAQKGEELQDISKRLMKDERPYGQRPEVLAAAA